MLILTEVCRFRPIVAVKPNMPKPQTRNGIATPCTRDSQIQGFGSQTTKSNKTGLEASLRLGVGIWEHERHESFTCSLFWFSQGVCELASSSGRVAILAFTGFHGNDTASNAEQFFLCWVTAQLLKRSLSLALSCRRQAEEMADMLGPGSCISQT